MLNDKENILPITKDTEYSLGVSWQKNLMSGLPNALLACVYALMFYRGVKIFGMDEVWLEKLMELEFIIPHSALFLGAALLISNDIYIRSILFSVVMLMYISIAFGVAGWSGLIMYVTAIISICFGLIINYTSNASYIAAGLFVRGFSCVLLYVFCVKKFGTSAVHVDAWQSHVSLVKTGVLFFLLLSIMESCGVFQRVTLKLTTPRNRHK